jgi:hypothetical protein
VKVYIVHFFDEHEHVRRSVRLDCSTDDHAISEAAQIRHRHVLELWQADRRVWRFEPPFSQLSLPGLQGAEPLEACA